MIITKKILPRRTFLRGVGATLALPLLDSMVPALSAQVERTPRLLFVYLPMGANFALWTPRDVGTITELSPSLRSLTPFLDQLTVFSNFCLNNSENGPGPHSTANCGFLSAARAKVTEGSDYELGITVDQIAAKRFAKDTRLPSLELAMDTLAPVGACDDGLACVYQNDLSWSSPTTPLPAEANPRLVFERLFGDGGTAADRDADLRANNSILDWVRDDIARLQKNLGPADRSKVSEYLDTVREVERRIQKAEEQAASSAAPDVDRPIGVPAAYEDHAKLMFDLQTLALRADITRVITYQLARETSTRTYPQVGVSEGHHPLSHHGDDPVKLAQLAKINGYHVSLFAYYLDKLKSTREGDGSLLDHSIVLCGSGMGNPDVHSHHNLPILVAGGAASKMKGGRHIAYKEPTPLANLHLTLLDKVGVHLDQFQDSTGRVDELLPL